MTPLSSFETELSRMIDLVDSEWYRAEDWIRFQALSPALMGIAIGAWTLYILFTGLFGVFETISLVIATLALQFSLIFALDYPARTRQLRVSTHFNKLENKTSDLLVLAALIRMRASLPVKVTLKSVYERDRDKSIFSQESLLHRALEPLH